MHLYTFSASPNGKRVNAFLKEKGIEIPTTEVDILAGGNLSPEYRGVVKIRKPCRKTQGSA
ncbi:MAG: hypothetical protein VB957_04365 [Pseudomonadales bacterium]